MAGLGTPALLGAVTALLAINSAAHVPFFLMLLGVFGGLRAFGLIGLLLGPIVLMVMLAVRREWLEKRLQATEHREASKADQQGPCHRDSVHRPRSRGIDRRG